MTAQSTRKTFQLHSISQINLQNSSSILPKAKYNSRTDTKYNPHAKSISISLQIRRK